MDQRRHQMGTSKILRDEWKWKHIIAKLVDAGKMMLRGKVLLWCLPPPRVMEIKAKINET